jgi:hypothetical protein
VTNFTATAGQTSFSTPSYTVGYINVFRNGVRLVSTDFTATTGTTVVLANACTVGDSVVTESFYVSSVLNALPTTGGTLSGNLVVSGTETVSTITSPAATALTLQTNNGTTAVTVDTSQNVGIGTTSPLQKLNVYTSAGSGGQIQIQNSATGTTATDGVLIGYDSSNDVIINNQENTQLKMYTSGILGASITSAGVFAFNSGYGSAATAYGCRAWANFSGVASVTVKGSGNVTSIAYTSAGKYTVSLATTLVDANYALSLGCCGLGTSGGGKLLVENSSGTGGTIGRTSSAFVLLSSYSFSNPGAGTDDNSYSNSFAVFR